MIEYVDLITKVKEDIYANPDEYILIRLKYIFDNLLKYIENGIKFSNDLGSFSVPYKGIGSKKGIGAAIYKNAQTSLEIVKSYLSGDFNVCNKKMDEWWRHQFQNKRHGLPATSITSNEFFYRIRHFDDTQRKIKRCDLFHVPFEKRGKISTNRYSVLGYPCLYLGRSIYTCWEESHRPNLNSFFVSAFRLSLDIPQIYLLDFRLERKTFVSEYAFRKYLCNMPMIIACSLRVNSYSNQFKPEYILPQLLLHKLIVPSGKITNWEGVIYSSTQVEDDFGITNGNCELADNIVIPIQKNAENGWCEELCRKFEITEPTNYEYELIKNPPQNATISGTIFKITSNLSPFDLMEERLKQSNLFRKIDYQTGK